MLEHTSNFQVALVLGGARSGKSRHALNLAASRPAPRLYLATAAPGDAEMAARIDQHRRERGPGWHTWEIPVALPEAIAKAQGQYSVVLVDCLTMWLSNLMAQTESSGELQAACDRLVAAVQAATTPLVLVSNEVGLSIVPDNPVAREFRDWAGMLHQRLAQSADRVVLLVAGLPLVLKGEG